MNFLCMQGVSCPTFVPLVDHPSNILDVVDYNGEKNPDHPLFRYEDGGEIFTIRWREAYQAFHTAARFVETQIKNSKRIQEPGSGAHVVVGILANLDSITFCSLIFGIMRAGYVPFLISTRNSDVAIAHLLRRTSSKYLFVSPDASMQNLARSALDKMREDTEFSEEQEVLVLRSPTFEELYIDVKQERFEPLPRVESMDMDMPAFIVHSSGSTAFPKPVVYTHYVLSQNSLIYYYGGIDMCGLTMSIHAIPIFHVMGAICAMWAARVGSVLGVFPPAQPPVMPTSDRVLAGALASQSDAVFVVPSFLEGWAKQPSLVEAMRTFDMICFGGGPLSQEVGDFLSEKGVTLVPLYGISEVGCIVKTFIKPHPEGWQYWELFPLFEASLIPTENENVFRLIVKETDSFRLVAPNQTLDGKKAFDTNDLVYRHPRNSRLYSYIARADDQITHSTGEKTNPVPLESILQRDSKIKAALMFGQGKFQPGVLVVPSDECAFDPSDSLRLAQFRNMIWETVEAANAYAPQHSKIFKELILVTNPSKPFEYTAKGTPRRHVCSAAYSAEIQAAYQAFEDSAQPGIASPSTWDFESIKGFMREVVKSALTANALGDDENIFALGADSLSATFIRNSIIRGLRSTSFLSLEAVRSLPPDFVFNLPSVNQLSAFTWGLVLTSAGVDAGTVEDDVEEEFEWPKEMAQPGQTILRVRKGKGEPPLIVFHGGGGDVDPFVPLYEKFKTALWFVQVTPEVPLTSLAEHVGFYYQKIKELRPQGPYRLAAHSASAMIMLYLADMLQKNGDSVTQLAFLDYFPTIQFAPSTEMDHDSFDITDPSMRWEYSKAALRSIIAMRQRQGAFRAQTAIAIGEAWEGKATSKYSAFIAQTAMKYGDEMLDFIARLPGYAASNAPADKPGRRAMEALEAWLKELKFGADVMTVYVAEDGILPGIREEFREEWKDLGVGRCFPGARVVNVKGGHETMLAQETLIKDMQRGFI